MLFRSIAWELDNLMNEPKLLEAMSQKARQVAENQTWEKYKEICAGYIRAACT
mgnify:CR=1 FL=1